MAARMRNVRCWSAELTGLPTTRTTVCFRGWSRHGCAAGWCRLWPGADIEAQMPKARPGQGRLVHDSERRSDP